jgi:hypothetical protein
MSEEIEKSLLREEIVRKVKEISKENNLHLSNKDIENFSYEVIGPKTVRIYFPSGLKLEAEDSQLALLLRALTKEELRFSALSRSSLLDLLYAYKTLVEGEIDPKELEREYSSKPYLEIHEEVRELMRKYGQPKRYLAERIMFLISKKGRYFPRGLREILPKLTTLELAGVNRRLSSYEKIGKEEISKIYLYAMER